MTRALLWVWGGESAPAAAGPRAEPVQSIAEGPSLNLAPSEVEGGSKGHIDTLTADAENVEFVAQIGGISQAVAVQGNYAYVAAGDAGLRIIDVTSPAAPTETSFYDTPGSAEDVAVVGDYVYVADGDSGLRIIDVTNPAAPRETGFLVTTESSSALAVAGDYAYVVNGYFRLSIINVADPTAPSETGSIQVTRVNEVKDVAVYGNWVLQLWHSPGALEIYNVADPAAPDQVAYFLSYPMARGVVIAASYAYVVGNRYNPPFGAGWLQAVDVSDPADPKEAGYHDLPEWANGLAVAGDPAAGLGHVYAYVVGRHGLRVVDVSDLADVSEAGFYEITGWAEDVAVACDDVYMAAGDAGLFILRFAAGHCVSGQVTEEDGTPIDGARVSTDGGYSGPTDANGFYTIIDLIAGIYTITPIKPGCIFTPASRTATVPPDAAGQDFVGRCAFDISGCLLDSIEQPMEGVQVSAGATHSTTTDASGNYMLTELPASTYTLIPATPGYFWSPANRIVAVPPDASGQDFTGYNIEKSVDPGGPHTVDYGDTLTYTVRLVYPHDRTLALYDRPPTYTTYLSGSLSGPAGVIYDAAANVISGTLNLAAGDPETVTFAVRVGVTGTVGFAPLIVNRACVYSVGEGLEGCTWSNEVLSFTYAWPVYLPLVVRNY